MTVIIKKNNPSKKHIALKCKNCHKKIDGAYCKYCGQATNFGRLNLRHVIQDLQNGLFSFNNGILYSVKQLFTRPGHSIRDYIKGKRVLHYQPISMLLLLSALYAFLHLKLNLNILDLSESPKEILPNFKSLSNFISENYSFIFFLYIPSQSLLSYFAYKSYKYNYIEHFVLNVFIVSQRLIAHIFLIPLIYWANKNDHNSIMNIFIRIIDLVLFSWVYLQFFNKNSKIKVFFLAILTYISNYILLILTLAFLLLYFDMMTPR